MKSTFSRSPTVGSQGPGISPTVTSMLASDPATAVWSSPDGIRTKVPDAESTLALPTA